MYTVLVSSNSWFTTQLWLTHNYMTTPRDYTFKLVNGSVEITFVNYSNYDWFFKRWIATDL